MKWSWESTVMCSVKVGAPQTYDRALYFCSDWRVIIRKSQEIGAFSSPG